MTDTTYAASVTVRQGKVYVPTMALWKETGVNLTIDPVYVGTASEDDLEIILKQCYEAQIVGIPPLSLPLPASGMLTPPKPYKPPEWKAAGVKSWRAFSRGAAVYSIVWYPDKIELHMALCDKMGRGAYSGTKSRGLPRTSDFRELALIVLEDARWYPSAWDTEGNRQTLPITGWLRSFGP